MGEKKIQVKVYVCERCDNEWQPRKDQIPTVCPGCMSPYWNRKREKAFI